MTAPALAAPVAGRAFTARRLHAAPTLDAAISAIWARISAGGAAACPMCQGEMAPESGAGELPVAGRCRDCGSVLS